MKIGISLNSTHPADGPADGPVDGPVDGPAKMIERARAAHQAGFASLTIGDHHNMPTRYAQNTPMLGRLLAEWPDRPAGCLFLVPLWHPLLMAEQIGTLAAMHPDRFIVQTGLGRGDDQFAAFGLTERTRGTRIERAVPIVQRLLAGETVDDEYFEMVGAKVGLRPDGPIEWWMGASADVGLERAARMGAVWYGGPANDATLGAERLERFRSYGGTRATIRKDALVLEDGGEARRVAAELVDQGYRGLGTDQLIVGSVEDAAAQISQLLDVGFEEVVIRCMTVPQDQAIETIELVGSLAS